MNEKNTSFSGLYSLALLLFSFVLLTCCYHLVYGQRGLVEWVKLSEQLEETRSELTRLEAEEGLILARIQRLRPGRIDPDFLDEQMVRVLGVRLNGPKHLIVQSEL